MALLIHYKSNDDCFQLCECDYSHIAISLIEKKMGCVSSKSIQDHTDNQILESQIIPLPEKYICEWNLAEQGITFTGPSKEMPLYTTINHTEQCDFVHVLHRSYDQKHRIFFGKIVYLYRCITT